MTGRLAAAVLSLGAALALSSCTSFFEIPIETPIQPKMDVSAFQRVLIAGFVSGGSEDVDANLETVRLLRSQLRTKSSLRVIEADVLPLVEMAKDQGAVPQSTNGDGTHSEPAGGTEGAPAIRDEKDLEVYESLFANVELWKKIGEEYQNPLIVTGTILFTPHERVGMVQREREVMDRLGRRYIEPVREYMERKGFILQEKFIFIDGRSGAQIYSEALREERLYNQNDNTPALSSYFELMDEIIPRFLSTLSTQRVRGSRVLIK